MAELRVDFDYNAYDESKGLSYKWHSAIQFAQYMLGVGAVSILVAICYWYYSFKIRGLSRHETIVNALEVFTIAFLTIWVVSTYYMTHRNFSGDYGKKLLMDHCRSVILDGDHIIYTDGTHFIEYHVAEVKRIIEKDTDVTIKFKTIYIVKNRVVEGDLEELIRQIKQSSG